MYGIPNSPNLDKDSSQIVVCPEREAAVCSCVSVSPVNALVSIGTPGKTVRQSRRSVQWGGLCGGRSSFVAFLNSISVQIQVCTAAAYL